MKKKLTIEVELTHGYITEQEVEVDIPAYTMASEVAFDVMRELKGNCFGVYMTLLSHRNMKNNKCFPSRETIMKETGLWSVVNWRGENQPYSDLSEIAYGNQ